VYCISQSNDAQGADSPRRLLVVTIAQRKYRMHQKHKLTDLIGINPPRSARKLFQALALEYDGISWADFRRFSGRDLCCFDEDSRWINGNPFRNYFDSFEDVEIGERFIQLDDEKAHRPSKTSVDA
jgi:hypothetical protein